MFMRLLIDPILLNQNFKTGGSTNNRKFLIIMPGMQSVEVAVACGVMPTGQQSGTGLTRQSENMTCALPHSLYCADGSWLFHLIAHRRHFVE